MYQNTTLVRSLLNKISLLFRLMELLLLQPLILQQFGNAEGPSIKQFSGFCLFLLRLLHSSTVDENKLEHFTNSRNFFVVQSFVSQREEMTVASSDLRICQRLFQFGRFFGQSSSESVHLLLCISSNSITFYPFYCSRCHWVTFQSVQITISHSDQARRPTRIS